MLRIVKRNNNRRTHIAKHLHVNVINRRVHFINRHNHTPSIIPHAHVLRRQTIHETTRPPRNNSRAATVATSTRRRWQPHAPAATTNSRQPRAFTKAHSHIERETANNTGDTLGSSSNSSSLIPTMTGDITANTAASAASLLLTLSPSTKPSTIASYNHALPAATPWYHNEQKTRAKWETPTRAYRTLRLSPHARRRQHATSAHKNKQKTTERNRSKP